MGKRIVCSCPGGSVSAAAANEQKIKAKKAGEGSPEGGLAAGTVLLRVGEGLQGDFLQMCDRYQHDPKV